MTIIDTASDSRRVTLTVREAAELLGVSQSALYDAVARGEIPVIRIGRRVLVKRIALLAMLDLGVTAEPS